MKNTQVTKIVNDMKTIEMELNYLHKREKKKFQELAFALNMENNELSIEMEYAGCMLVVWSNELAFEVKLDKFLNNYILRPVVFNEHKDEVPLYLNKINRKQANTIVQHMKRIAYNLPELIEQRLAYFEELKRASN